MEDAERSREVDDRFAAIRFLFATIIHQLPDESQQAIVSDVSSVLREMDERARTSDTDILRDRAATYHDFLSPIRDEIL